MINILIQNKNLTKICQGLLIDAIANWPWKTPDGHICMIIKLKVFLLIFGQMYNFASKQQI